MKKKNLLIIGVVAMSSLILGGCFDKPEPQPEVDNPPVVVEDTSEEEEVLDNKYETYGNGTSIVNYKGNLYYIEFSNNDFEKETLYSPKFSLAWQTNNQRYVNRINSRGNIENLFKVTGTDKLNIVADRFYLTTNSGFLYTVDMKGENSIELGKGQYIAFDEAGNAVYYQNADSPNTLYKIDTTSLSISLLDFDNPLTRDNYNYIGIRDNNLYYSLFDSKNSKLILVEHNIEKNTNEEIFDLKMELHYDENKKPVDIFADSASNGKYFGVAYGAYYGGSLSGYTTGTVYLFDLENKTIKKGSVAPEYEGSYYDTDDMFRLVVKDLYKEVNNKELPDVKSFITETDIKDFASRYRIDLDAKLGLEAEGTNASSGDSKYVVGMENFTVKGNNVFYKITAARRSPTTDVGWRPAYIRIATEVYAKNLLTGDKVFIYPYVNSKFTEMEQKIEEALEEKNKPASGDEPISETEPLDNTGEVTPTSGAEERESVTNQEEELKENEMYLNIKVSTIWKKEFDLKVEEVGIGIMGKRIEYEGHHKKEDGDIRIKVSKEVGARLTVYVDNDLHSQMIIEE